jgi:hypothetical protein
MNRGRFRVSKAILKENVFQCGTYRREIRIVWAPLKSPPGDDVGEAELNSQNKLDSLKIFPQRVYGLASFRQRPNPETEKKYRRHGPVGPH